MRYEIRDTRYVTRDTRYEIRDSSSCAGRKQGGQAIIILLLIMLVALSVGLSLTQRSVTDVATSTQTEQSSRAFSAAEAGIEKALSSPLPLGYVLPLGNNSSAVIDTSGLLPYNVDVGIEYPAIGRETTAQFWFVDPLSPASAAPPAFYTGSSVDLYYGNAGTADLPAVEVKILIEKNNVFYVKNYYYDSSSARTSDANPYDNKFTPTASCGTQTLPNGILGTNRQFFCKQTIGPIKDPTVASNPPDCNAASSCKLVLARIRFLYINENHSLALAPETGKQFPPQIQIYNATGTSGQSQKQIQAFKVKDVILPWFDFAVFSTNEIRK